MLLFSLTQSGVRAGLGWGLMSVTQVMDRLYQINVPTPFKVGPVNCYLSIGDPITLIDTGPLHADTRAKLNAGLKEIGVTRSDIQRIIVTHAHSDHYGLAAEIVRDSNAEVWTHRYNRSTLEAHEADRQRRSEFYWQIMIEAGVPDEERQRLADSRHGGERFAESVKIDRTIDEGDKIEFAHKHWQVYHTPGHAGGLIVLFDPVSRVLLSNDHLLRDISSNPVVEPAPEGGPRPHRLVEYIYHLQRMIELKPVVAWTGHGDPVRDVAKLVKQRLAFHSRRAEKIIDLLGAADRHLHRNAEQCGSAYALAEPLFGRLNGIDSFLALSETIGHLEWLQEQGRVTSIEREGVVYWRRL
ncbi:MAG TPA: MBL fold metallo-hydrolase [Anaerolineae bacterium]|nr:MBL fold metallo-hydrolase [Anaerolineae bacterium]